MDGLATGWLHVYCGRQVHGGNGIESRQDDSLRRKEIGEISSVLYSSFLDVGDRQLTKQLYVNGIEILLLVNIPVPSSC